MIDTNTTPMTRDDRDDLAAAAEGASRRNRPVWLVLFGVLALVLAGLYAGASWYGLRAAQRKADTRQTQLTKIAELAATLRAYESAAAAQPDQPDTGEIPTLFSDLERHASQAGLADKPLVPKRSYDNIGSGMRRVNYPYAMTDESPESLLRWVKIVTDRVPGMRVRSIGLVPTGQKWKLDVTFARVVRQ